MNEEKEIIEIPQYEIGVMRDPKAVLAEAKLAAQSLMTVVSQKTKPVIMNGEQYLEFEDWQTVARFYGVTAKVVRTAFIDLGGVKGYEATAEAIRISDGMAISSADAMCLNDEDKWSTRSKYEYVNGEREKVGEVPVPLFQLRSMAQTRACAKSLRNVLAWVVVLAGFKPTPAEEMTGHEKSYNGKPKVAMPQEKSNGDKRLISDKQGNRLLAIASANGYTKDLVLEYVKGKHGLEHLGEITTDIYDAVVAHFEGKNA